MSTLIRVDEDIKQKLKIKSAETGLTQLELTNKYILKGLEEDDTPSLKELTLEEIKSKFKNNIEGSDEIKSTDKYSLEDLIGIIKLDKEIDSQELIKKMRLGEL